MFGRQSPENQFREPGVIRFEEKKKGISPELKSIGLIVLCVIISILLILHSHRPSSPKKPTEKDLQIIRSMNAENQ
jgi:hypothetical protein